MRPLDWLVLFASFAGIVVYGICKGRGSNTVERYLLAGKTMPWYAMALSIMATQASAITFISTTGQSYVDGMRFVQFYFGLPVAMVIIAAVAAPIFYRSGVYTAYEYLEKRFDSKTRSLVSAIFLIQRGLAAGIALAAPAIVLSLILNWPDRITILLMGGLVIPYTVSGGIKAVTWTDMQQMLIMFAGLFAALITAILLLPQGVSLGDAVSLAGAVGKLNAVVLKFDLKDDYNLWSGLIGGAFLALAYFGTDQSQVQRYLTGKSLAQSRLSLLFNGVAKVPMQFLILFTGATVFVFYIYTKPPMLFETAELRAAGARLDRGAYDRAERDFAAAFERRRMAAGALIEARRNGGGAPEAGAMERYRAAQKSMEDARARGIRLVERASGGGFNDTNYIFLTFVTRYMPAGVVGLIMAAIFAAAMSGVSAEINSLATVSVIDIYRRHIRAGASDRHYLWASRILTAFWGCYAIAFAQYAKSMGTLVVAVNAVGSLFYGGMLGIFVLAFAFPRVRGTAAFVGVLAGEAAIFYCRWCTGISFLWYNVVGCLVVVTTGVALSGIRRGIFR
jgi:Na+/proline symporter